VSGLFLFVGIGIGVIGRLGEKGLVAALVGGAKNLLGVTLIIGLARDIVVVLGSGHMTDKVLFWEEESIAGLNSVVFILVMYWVEVAMSFFVPSTLGLAVPSMPMLSLGGSADRHGRAPVQPAKLLARCGAGHPVPHHRRDHWRAHHPDGKAHRRTGGGRLRLYRCLGLMGEPDSVWEERFALLFPYQVNTETMEMTGNPHAKFLHCLPAFHNRDTKVGEATFQKFGIDCMEVTEAVFESAASVVFDQAKNRMHTIKALLVATMKL
jgi:hypothetical protein